MVLSVMIPCSMADMMFLIARFALFSSSSRMEIWDCSSWRRLYATVLSAIHAITSSCNAYSLMALATASSMASRRTFALLQAFSTLFFWQV